MVMHAFGTDVLVESRLDTPTPGPGEVLVRVRATFVSFGRDVERAVGATPSSRAW